MQGGKEDFSISPLHKLKERGDIMPANSKAEYDMLYAKKNLKRIPLNVQKEKYVEIQLAAQSSGESVNGYIKKAINLYPEITSDLIFTFLLDKDISFNDEVHSDLINVLERNNEVLSGFTRKGSSLGEYKLMIRFKPNISIEQHDVIAEFAEVLKQHNIPYSYSRNTFLGQDIDTKELEPPKQSSDTVH